MTSMLRPEMQIIYLGILAMCRTFADRLDALDEWEPTTGGP